MLIRPTCVLCSWRPGRDQSLGHPWSKQTISHWDILQTQNNMRWPLQCIGYSKETTYGDVIVCKHTSSMCILIKTALSLSVEGVQQRTGRVPLVSHGAAGSASVLVSAPTCTTTPLLHHCPLPGPPSSILVRGFIFAQKAELCFILG